MLGIVEYAEAEDGVAAQCGQIATILVINGSLALVAPCANDYLRRSLGRLHYARALRLLVKSN